MTILEEQSLIFAAVFIHVMVTGLLAIIIDELFPKYHPKASVPRLMLKIACRFL